MATQKKLEQLARDVDATVVDHQKQSGKSVSTYPILALELTSVMLTTQLETNRLLGQLIEGIKHANPGGGSGDIEKPKDIGGGKGDDPAKK
jgi:hypothetical protein